jgi:hypothetical protein
VTAIPLPTVVVDNRDGTWSVWLNGRLWRRCKTSLLRTAEQAARDLETELLRRRNIHRRKESA